MLLAFLFVMDLQHALQKNLYLKQIHNILRANLIKNWKRAEMAIALKKRVKHRKEKAKSSNTLRAYKGDWLKFLDYCQNSEDLAKNDDNIHPNKIKDIREKDAYT